MNNNNEPQFFNTREEIDEWLNKYNVRGYTINDDLSVDVKWHADISARNLKNIPIKFRDVGGGFYCYRNQLTNLIGSPKTVGGHFDCSYNELTNLEGITKKIGSNLWCQGNLLLSLLEMVNCDFKGEIIFNIDEENFKPKEPELIQTLKKYYKKTYKYYGLTLDDFNCMLKPQLEK